MSNTTNQTAKHTPRERTRDEKMLFEIVEATGETLNGSLHIISNNSDIPVDEREGEYRVYHIDKICFDVKKEYVCEPDEIDQYENVWSDGFTYSFYQEWEGFKNDLTLEGAIKLIETNSHLPITRIEDNILKQYAVIANYHPTITKKGGVKEPTDEPILLKGDVLTQKGKDDSVFQSRDKKGMALYEHTLKSYPQFFKVITKATGGAK